MWFHHRNTLKPSPLVKINSYKCGNFFSIWYFSKRFRIKAASCWQDIYSITSHNQNQYERYSMLNLNFKELFNIHFVRWWRFKRTLILLTNKKKKSINLWGQMERFSNPRTEINARKIDKGSTGEKANSWENKKPWRNPKPSTRWGEGPDRRSWRAGSGGRRGARGRSSWGSARSSTPDRPRTAYTRFASLPPSIPSPLRCCRRFESEPSDGTP